MTDRPASGTPILDSTIIPGTALLMSHVMAYSSAVSFALRPDQYKRMVPVQAFFVGIILGGLIFPRLVAWSSATGHGWRRSVLVFWLVSALVCTAPGLNAYVFSSRLRLASNLFGGMQIAPVYWLFFPVFPPTCAEWVWHLPFGRFAVLEHPHGHCQHPPCSARRSV